MASEGEDGPSFEPPALPAGWIAQWDGVGKKYYYVQLSTGVSQWDTPTKDAPTVSTPIASPAVGESPYAQPGSAGRENSTSMERGISSSGDGPTGDRGIGVSGFVCAVRNPLMMCFP